MASARRIMTDLVLSQTELPPHKIKIAYHENNVHDIFFLIEIEDNKSEYLGQMIFPNNFPFTAPRIKFITPTGFFRQDEDVCLTLVSHIHNEQWTPIWRIHTILIAIKSFLYDQIKEHPEHKKYSDTSLEFNKARPEIKMFL